jgi:hypothetical protein
LPDHGFELKLRYQDASPKCNGTWKYTGKDTLILECAEVTDINTTLSNGYMNERYHALKIVNNNTLKFKNSILKRLE